MAAGQSYQHNLETRKMDNLREHKSCKPVVLKEINSGKLISISNLFHFCEKNDINYQGIKNLFYNLKGGNHLTCQGYCIPETTQDQIKLSRLTQKWKQLWGSAVKLSNHHTGQDIVITKNNIIDFCEVNGMKPRVIWDLYSEAISQYKGWYLSGKNIKIKTQLHTEPVKMVSPDGVEIKVDNICAWVRNEFASHLPSKEAHKKYRSFHKLVKGQSKVAYGYTLKK